MFRHIFIGIIKKDVTEEKINKHVNELKALKGCVPEALNLSVGVNLGWYMETKAIISYPQMGLL